jgi:GNAT superfamily N-acetyltransferase
MRQARLKDIPVLIELMSSFYAESGYDLNHQHAEKAFATLVANEKLGYVWLIDEDGKQAGYLVVTFRFGMEYGGMIAYLDDLYIIPEHRNRGLSTTMLGQVRDLCKELGILAITVEVAPNNGPAQTVYRRMGLAETPNRQLLSLPLSKPTHVV